MVKEFFDEALNKAAISKDRRDILKLADSTLKVNIPLVRDDGSIEMIACYRCQHKHHRVPTKGGTRMALDVDL
jgi:glutamate dehydrogenase (NAD(P)+)